MAIFLATLALAFSAITLALWLGDSPEKTGAKIILAQVLINVIGHRIVAFHYAKIDPVSTLVDAVGLIGFCAIALHARRIWPLWVSSLELIAVMAHVVRAMDIHIHPVAYAMMNWGPTDLTLMILLWGTANHWRRKRKGVNLLPWRSWSDQSNQSARKNSPRS